MPMPHSNDPYQTAPRRQGWRRARTRIARHLSELTNYRTARARTSARWCSAKSTPPAHASEWSIATRSPYAAMGRKSSYPSFTFSMPLGSPAMVAATQHQANTQGLPVVSIEGNAERLPVPDASYDLSMANHVLFLIADQRAALRELRRVLKPSGRVVLTTNSEDHCERLTAVHRAAAQRLGYKAVERVMGRFHLGHLRLVREAFPTAQCFVREDSFLFPTTDAALSYYGSGLVDAIVDPPAGGEHRARLLALVGDEINAIIRREGVFRVPKDSGCFVVSV